MNNATSYAQGTKPRLIYDSDQEEEEYHFIGNNIIRANKSISVINHQTKNAPRLQQKKKSASFLHPKTTKPIPQTKDHSKATSRHLNVTQGAKKKVKPANKSSTVILNAPLRHSKATKSKSISRDYMMIAQNIYECENIQELNEKLICGSSSLYTHERFIKATLKNQQKLERYFRGFLLFCLSNKNHQIYHKQHKESQQSHKKLKQIEQDKYPQAKKQPKLQIQRYLPNSHILSKEGIVSFVQNLWNYMVDENQIDQILGNLRIPYGLSSLEKVKFIAEKEIHLQQTLIIRNQVFKQFCKSHSAIQQLSSEQQKRAIILYKAVFDSLNRQLTKFTTDFPYGPYHPFEENNSNAVYFIDESNIMTVWEQCLEAIVQKDKINIGKIKNVSSQENKEQLKDQFKDQEIFCQWDRFKPLFMRNVLEDLIFQIKKELIYEFCNDFQKF